MGTILIGANHRSAPVSVREQLAFTDEACVSALRRWQTIDAVKECLVLSTCNRVELLAVTEDSADQDGVDQLTDFLSEASSLSRSELSKHLYTYTGEDAVRHVCRVASSLDSMVVGEPQILGQLRKAYSLATEAGTTGTTLNKLLPHALHVAKRVRNETDIAGSAVSVSYMAVELGRKIFDSLAGYTALVIGGGPTAELVARHLIKAGVSRVLFANRTQSKAEELASAFAGQAVALDNLVDHLSEADIVICSTSSPTYVITPEMIRAARTLKQRTIFLIDISVPRNIDPAVGEIENAFVFNIDDLKSLVLSNIDQRQREAKRAEEIVEQEVIRFREVLQALRLGPAISRLRERMQEIAREELKRQRQHLGPLTQEQECALEVLLFSTIRKISHPIITQMRRGAIQVEF
ncbi:MAG: glutamyl-tRNA reductase [Pyrinomonadaceae bacterium]